MNLNLVKLSHYNIPHLVERPNQDWVSFGEDNLYPNYLLELFLGSAINGALIKSIGAMIYGEGLAATNADESESNKESFLRLTELLHNSDDDVLKDLAMDLKLFGGCYVNVIWSRDRSKIAKLLHIPAQYVRSGKMVDGSIDTYYYSADWSKTRKSEYRPRPYAAFNTEDRTQASQILMIRDKNPALFYGFAPDYVAATDWIQMELEIAQFHLSNITSGMTPSMHVGFSNGVPTEEERRTIERQLNQKFAGSGNAGKILLTFNDGKDTAPIIEPIQMNDAQSAWEGMSKQAVNQILAGHRCVSPLLFGIRTEGGNGLGSNADELRDAYSLFNNTVVVPFQNILLRGLDKVFRINDINLDLYFKTLKPADFIDLDVVKTQSDDDQEKEGVSNEEIEQEDLKHEFKEDLSDDEFDEIFNSLEGEIIDEEEWEMVDEKDQDEIEDYEEWAKSLIAENKKETMADVITANPNGFSYLDKSFYKIRFKYVRAASGGGKSRTFCRNMMAKSGQGVVYRLEGIDKASRAGVNRRLGHKGRSYDLFTLKGGIYCRHAWRVVLYRLKKGSIAKGKIGSDDLDDYKRASTIPKSYMPKPRGIDKAVVATNNLPGRGKYPGT